MLLCRSSRVQAQDKFYKLYLDERLQEVKQGKRPEQVAADRAAFLMDAAMLGANVRKCTQSGEARSFQNNIQRRI